MRFGQRKLPRAFLPVVAAVIIALLIAIATDLVRLGPATIDLPKNAMGLTIEISRIAVNMSAELTIYELLACYQ